MNFSDDYHKNFGVLDERKVLMEQIHRNSEEWLRSYWNLRQSAEMLFRGGDTTVEAAALLFPKMRDASDIISQSDSDHDKENKDQECNRSQQEPLQRISNLEMSEEFVDSENIVQKDQPSNPTNITNLTKENEETIVPGTFADVEKLLDALLRLTEMYRAPQTVAVMLADLKHGSFNFGQIKDPYANVRSTLRYYTDLFERDGSQWKRKPQIAAEKLPNEARQENNAIVSPQIVNEENLKEAVDRQNPSSEVETAEAVDNNKVVSIFSRQSANQLIGVDESKAPESNTNGKKRILTYPQLCEEILLTSGQPWLHLDQFLVYLERDYGLKVEKAVIASALRKNAKAGRRFKSHGGNRFGLIDQPEAARATA